jgi:hypothetical protein
MEETVDIYVTVGESGIVVPGVLVRFFDNTGSIVTEAVTDVNGQAGVLLPQGTYTMRFYKFACSFQQPQQFSVVAGTNAFNVKLQTMSRPLATDPRLCRCSGFFRGLNGASRPWLDMHFTAQFSAAVIDGAGVTPGTLIARTDDKGWVSLDLIRGAMYDVSIEELGCSRSIMVPDASRANLPDVLFPVVNNVEFDVVSALVGVGATTDVTPTVVTTSGVPLIGTATGDVNWVMDNPNIASVAVREKVLTITGVVAGTTFLRVTRRDSSIIRIPATEVAGQPLQVVVS